MKHVKSVICKDKILIQVQMVKVAIEPIRVMFHFKGYCEREFSLILATIHAHHSKSLSGKQKSI